MYLKSRAEASENMVEERHEDLSVLQTKCLLDCGTVSEHPIPTPFQYQYWGGGNILLFITFQTLSKLQHSLLKIIPARFLFIPSAAFQNSHEHFAFSHVILGLF